MVSDGTPEGTYFAHRDLPGVAIAIPLHLVVTVSWEGDKGEAILQLPQGYTVPLVLPERLARSKGFKANGLRP